MIQRFLALALLLPTLAWADVSRYEAVIAADTPSSWWKLNDTSGTTAVDSAAGPHNLTYVGSPLLNQATTAIAGTPSVMFDGTTSQYANNTEDTGDCAGTWGNTTKSRSVEVWVNFHAANGSGNIGGYIISDVKNAAGKWGWALYAFIISNTSFIVYNNGSGGTYQDCPIAHGSGGANAADTWYYVVGTFNLTGTVSKIYVNGALMNTCNTPTGTQGCGQNLWVGQRADLPNFTGVNGWIQEPAFYNNVVLTGTQVATHYNAGVASPTGGLNPFSVKAPDLPHFWEKNYFTKMVAQGYDSGHFDITAKQPQYFMVGYLPFMTVPNADLNN